MRACGWKCRTAVYPVGRVGWALENGCVRASLTRIGCSSCRRSAGCNCAFAFRRMPLAAASAAANSSDVTRETSRICRVVIAPSLFFLDSTLKRQSSLCSLAPLDDTERQLAPTNPRVEKVNNQTGSSGVAQVFFLPPASPSSLLAHYQFAMLIRWKCPSGFVSRVAAA